MQRYSEEVNNINNDFHEHKRFQEEIELINEKENLLKVIVEKNKTFKALYSDYLIKRFNYWKVVQSNAQVQLHASFNVHAKNQADQQYTEKRRKVLNFRLKQLLKLKTNTKKLRNPRNR